MLDGNEKEGLLFADVDFVLEAEHDLARDAFYASTNAQFPRDAAEIGDGNIEQTVVGEGVGHEGMVIHIEKDCSLR